MNLRKASIDLVNKYCANENVGKSALTEEIYYSFKSIQHSYYYNDSDEYNEGEVFVIMPFTGNEMHETYNIITEECKRIGLNAKSVDEKPWLGISD